MKINNGNLVICSILMIGAGAVSGCDSGGSEKSMIATINTAATDHQCLSKVGVAATINREERDKKNADKIVTKAIEGGHVRFHVQVETHGISTYDNDLPGLKSGQDFSGSTPSGSSAAKVVSVDAADASKLQCDEYPGAIWVDKKNFKVKCTADITVEGKTYCGVAVSDCKAAIDQAAYGTGSLQRDLRISPSLLIPLDKSPSDEPCKENKEPEYQATTGTDSGTAVGEEADASANDAGVATEVDATVNTSAPTPPVAPIEDTSRTYVRRKPKYYRNDVQQDPTKDQESGLALQGGRRTI